MNKRDFVKMFAERTMCRDDEAALVIESLLKAIVEVTANDRLYFVGFGEFKRHKRVSKNGDTDHPAELKFKASIDLPEIYWQEWDAKERPIEVQMVKLPERPVVSQCGEPLDIASDLALQENGDYRKIPLDALGESIEKV